MKNKRVMIRNCRSGKTGREFFLCKEHLHTLSETLPDHLLLVYNGDTDSPCEDCIKDTYITEYNKSSKIPRQWRTK